MGFPYLVSLQYNFGMDQKNLLQEACAETSSGQEIKKIHTDDFSPSLFDHAIQTLAQANLKHTLQFIPPLHL